MAKFKYNYIRSLLRGEKPKISVSMYKKQNSSLNEGDITVDDFNYEWITKRFSDGSLYREKQSKLSDARVPLWCPKCKIIMRKRLDDKMFRMHGMCFDCVIDRDTQMKIEGTYEEYEKNFMLSKLEGFLKDSKKEIKEYLDNMDSHVNFINENGSIEKWKVNTKQIKEFLQKELMLIDHELEKVDKIRNGECGWI